MKTVSGEKLDMQSKELQNIKKETAKLLKAAKNKHGEGCAVILNLEDNVAVKVMPIEPDDQAGKNTKKKETTPPKRNKSPEQLQELKKELDATNLESQVKESMINGISEAGFINQL